MKAHVITNKNETRIYIDDKHHLYRKYGSIEFDVDENGETKLILENMVLKFPIYLYRRHVKIYDIDRYIEYKNIVSVI